MGCFKAVGGVERERNGGGLFYCSISPRRRTLGFEVDMVVNEEWQW